MGAAVTTKEFVDLRKKVCEHEDWIDGTNTSKGAKSRIDILEVQFKSINGKLNWILTVMGSIFVAVLVAVINLLGK